MLSHTLFQTCLNKLPLFRLGLTLGIGLLTLNAPPLLASQGKDAPVTAETREVYVAQGDRADAAFADGTYLYGRSTTPDEIGQEYLVFKVDGGRVVGAFYMPQSEFSCFSGTLNARAMNLSIVDPYDKTSYPYSIALRDVSPIASTEGLMRNMGLDGYHQIQTVSDNDRRMLDTCVSDFQ